MLPVLEEDGFSAVARVGGLRCCNLTHPILIHGIFLLSRLLWIICFKGQTLTLTEL